MCAIAGVLGGYITPGLIEEIFSTMKRRGPDQHGLYMGKGISLFHSRLSIIDPDGGKQPMTVEYGGEIFTIAYNGELYNAAELRLELERLGHTFSGKCDTEVVLRSYIEWREEALQKFNGIFGFAVWEHKKERLFLARDRIGVKPLFYAKKGELLVFASEIKTILKHPQISRKIDQEGIVQILCLGPGRKPGSGVFQDISELKPGHFAVVQDGRLIINRYWKLLDREHSDDFETTAETVRYLVTDSIKRQMVSDFPLGTFLSGGLDSSIISAVCADKKKRAGEQLQTFSVDYQFNDKFFKPGKFQPNADVEYIQIMKEHIGSNHQTTVLTVQDLTESLENATKARDLPGMADVDFSLLAFCKEIRKGVKVGLSGECADEIFGGYPWYRDPDVRAVKGFPWAQNTSERVSLLQKEITINAEEYVNDLYLETLHDADILPGTSAIEKRMKEMVVLNQSWFMQTLLDRKDRMSMWSGLEVRVPFCDYRIVEYLYGVPWEMKDYKGREKGLLRYAVRGILPDAILHRKKSPYPKTYDPAYMNAVKERMEIVLQDPTAPIHNITDTSVVRKVISGESPWPWYGQLMKLPQTIAYMLQIDYWMREYKVEIT